MALAPWNERNITALFSILKNNNVVSQLDSAKRNDYIYKQVASELIKTCEYNFSAQQVRTKVKALKHAYKSGRSRETCKFFEDMDEIWGNRPTDAPPVLIDSGMLEISLLPCSKVESFDISNNSGGENGLYADEVEPSTSSSDSNSRLASDPDHVPLSTSSKKNYFGKRKLVKLDWTKEFMAQYEEQASKQMKEFLEIQFKHENETLSKWMKFEEEREKRQQDHELKVLQLLMKK